jgi:hypothetical protein
LVKLAQAFLLHAGELAALQLMQQSPDAMLLTDDAAADSSPSNWDMRSTELSVLSCGQFGRSNGPKDKWSTCCDRFRAEALSSFAPHSWRRSLGRSRSLDISGGWSPSSLARNAVELDTDCHGKVQRLRLAAIFNAQGPASVFGSAP